VFVARMETFKTASKPQDLGEVDGISDVEHYSYLFDMDCQELDHSLIGKMSNGGVDCEHVHVNTWSTVAARSSDHDPAIARLDICEYERVRVL
jgi:predicted extracellular nuclease